MGSLYAWIAEHLGLQGAPYGRYYVYELLDPRLTPHRIFYVGMGVGERMYQHEKDAKRLLRQGPKGVMRLLPHHKRIIEILDDGYQVEYRVIFRTDSQAEAFQVESYNISQLGLERLLNSTYGYGKQAIKRVAERERGGRGKKGGGMAKLGYEEDEYEVLPHTGHHFVW